MKGSFSKWLCVFFLALVVLGLVLGASSCDCNYHLKKAKKKCGISSLSDTLYVHDTTITKEIRKDTLFHYMQKDTVIIKEGKLVMKYFYKNDTVLLRGACLSDTVIKQVPYYVTNNTLSPDETTWKDYVLWAALAVVIILALLRR